jgi:hypothetical protein
MGVYRMDEEGRRRKRRRRKRRRRRGEEGRITRHKAMIWVVPLYEAE